MRRLVPSLLAMLLLAGCVQAEEPTTLPHAPRPEPRAEKERAPSAPPVAPASSFGFSEAEPAPAASPSTREHAPRAWDRRLPDVIEGLRHLGHAQEAPRAQALRVHEDRAYLLDEKGELVVLDLSEPQFPRTLGRIAARGHALDLMLHADGRRTVAVASDEGLLLYDVTRADPWMLGGMRFEGPVLDVAVLGTFVYPALGGARTATPANLVVDASDPGAPRNATAFGAASCHDVSVLDAPGKSRLYCVTPERFDVWDLASPTRPAHVGGARHAPGAMGVDARATPSHDGNVLLVADGVPRGAPACGTPAAGLVRLYDLAGERERAPRAAGTIGAPVPTDAYLSRLDKERRDERDPLACAPRVAGAVQGRALAAVSWQNAGVVLVDFGDVDKPRALDRWEGGANVQEVRYQAGHLYTADLARGLDVLTFR